MVFLILMIVYSMLILVAFDGDREERERKKDYEKYDEIVGKKKWD